MLTDYQILNIPETDDISIIKDAYRKIVKKIHPDVSKTTFNNHLLFIQVNNAYQRLLEYINNKSDKRERKQKKPNVSNNSILNQKDPAYSFYKAGMNEFMKIHPSKWTKNTKKIMDKPGPKDLNELNKIKEKVKELVQRFPLAYYYFSIVVNEFPESIWSYDSKEKMKKIEEMTIRYKKIVESFIEHAKIFPKINRMFYGKKI